MNKGQNKGHKGQMSDREAMKLALEALEKDPAPLNAIKMKTTEVTIEMDGLHITTVSAPNTQDASSVGKAQIGDFHMSLFTWEEWQYISLLIGKAIREVTK